jgi:hypothetical protein
MLYKTSDLDGFSGITYTMENAEDTKKLLGKFMRSRCKWVLIGIIWLKTGTNGRLLGKQ